MSMTVRAPILRRCALSFENALSLGFQVQLRYQYLRNVSSKIGAIYDRDCIFNESFTEGIAPLSTQGAISASAPGPAMKLCDPHDPQGASITCRSPR